MTTSETAADRGNTASSRAVALRAAYVPLPPSDEMPGDVLLAVTFGRDRAPAVPLAVQVPLEPLVGGGLAELWYANGPVHAATTGAIRHAADGHFLAGVIEVDEREHGGIVAATEHAYRTIAQFQVKSAYPHLLRTWNYLDAINQGEGDAERYRGFCSGRVAGLEGLSLAQHPAATVIGRRDGQPLLQVYWLAARVPGMALENPRQISAYQYPRQYGRTSPTFSRAMWVAPDALMISGTASIVGHASRHAGSVVGQVEEILANLDALLSRAHSHAPDLPAEFGGNTLLKVYLRNRGDVPLVENHVSARLPEGAPLLVLLGDVCRADLLVEFDCLHTAEAGTNSA
jgi:chorismate lyase/3-hydroxybenzoate synthase